MGGKAWGKDAQCTWPWYFLALQQKADLNSDQPSSGTGLHPHWSPELRHQLHTSPSKTSKAVSLSHGAKM